MRNAPRVYSKILLAALIVFALGFMAPTPGHCAMLLGNLNGDDGNQTGIAVYDRAKALGFTMPGTPYSLDSVILRLEISDYTTTTTNLALYSDNSLQVGTALLSFNSPSFLQNGVHNYLFTPVSPFTLQANSTYWLVFYSSDNGRVDWKADSAGIDPSAIATYAGVYWDSTFPPSGSSSTINSLQVDGTAAPVPIPGSLLLLGPGLLGLAAIRRRFTK